MKKIVFMFLILLSQAYSAVIVFDPNNYQSNMQQYQVNLLQKIEQVKTATDTARQATYDIQNLKDNATNLESWAGVLLGEENQILFKAIDDLNAINKNSQAVLRNSKKISEEFDEFYLPTDRLKNLNSKELANEIYKVSKNRRYNLKDNLKTATTILEQIENDRNSTASFVSSTDGAKGQLQSAMATKKGIDQLNNKISRSLDLQAKQLLALSQNEADKITEEELEEEMAKRILQVSDKANKIAEEIRKTGRM
ncbi:hypothetical protein [Fusobacterium sp. SYSU M8D902]|uniref:hypothetical protein n=1 Tax=Fusobacterium sp. SYSU M8D902 TaxID=3159562 RepID=UPI0032E3A6C1